MGEASHGYARRVRQRLSDGWLRDARVRPSPHYDDRPAGATMDAIVVHAISLPPGGRERKWVEQLFHGQLPPDQHPYFAEIATLRVSAHVVIDRDGGVTQFVPLHKRAWHAGVSAYGGRERWNDFSVGIELIGDDDTPFEGEQYRALARVITAVRRACPTMTVPSIVGHCDIAPGRKTDPGPHFSWQRLAAITGLDVGGPRD